MIYDLPRTVSLQNETFKIRSDYRVILDILEVYHDDILSQNEKAITMLLIFYVDFERIYDYKSALEKLMWFINCGDVETSSKEEKKQMDWIKDFKIIISPINKVLGYECRSVKYLHWWTFISAYMEIGECLFSTVVGIRNKLNKGKALEKWEKEFYKKNQDMVDLKSNSLNESEMAIVNNLLNNG